MTGATGRSVGLVGVGTMGVPVAANLLGAGYDVVGYRRSAMPQEFVDRGGRTACGPDDLATRCDVVLVILSGPEDLLEVALGEHGLLAGAHAGTVVVEMSTMPREAVTGRVEHLGAFGTGSVTMSVAHLLVAVNTLAAAEALGLARRGGVDLDRLLEVLSGTVASSTALTLRGARMAHGPYRPAPGSVTTLHEGLEQVDDFARHLHTRPPLLGLALELYGRARADGHADDDIAVMIDVLDAVMPEAAP